MLESLFSPRAIAVVGTTFEAGSPEITLIRQLQSGGYVGTLSAVGAGEPAGVAIFPSLAHIPGMVDLALLAVPAEAVERALVDAIDKGAGAVAVLAGGFGESGLEGAEAEWRLAELARAHKVRLLGPNGAGVLTGSASMNATLALQLPLQGGISLIGQSGAVCGVLLDWARPRGIGFEKVISMGNKADLSEVDLLRALARDPHTHVIAGYLEDIRLGPEFIRAAEQAAAEKPVVLIKAGVSESGRRAASSHTGSLAGAEIAYGAAFARAGVIRAATLDDLLDISHAFARLPLPEGARVAVITNAGGLGVLAADAVEEGGLLMASFSEATRARLEALALSGVGNPLELGARAQGLDCRAAVEVLLADPEVSSVIAVVADLGQGRAAALVEAIAAADTHQKPLITCLMGDKCGADSRAALHAAGRVVLPSPERAVRALKAMGQYAAWRHRPPRVVERFPVNKLRVQRILNRQMRLHRSSMGEVEAKQILRAYDFVVPDGAVVHSAEEAVEVAARVAFPVALKIASGAIHHKSDVGGVRLNLHTAEAVRDAYDLMMLRMERQFPEAILDGVNVERMAPAGREVIIGMSRDPRFGPMLMFGLGGVFVEVMKDVTFYLAPITHNEAMEMLESTRSFALLKGSRGQREVDLHAIAEGIQRISQLATDFPMITELDINPFIVGVRGAGGVVADARMALDLGVTR